MGNWMPDITKKPTLAQKIKFGHDASDIHLYWKSVVEENPSWIPYVGDADFHEECAVLHEETAIELEELAKLKGEKNPGCLMPFRRTK